MIEFGPGKSGRVWAGQSADAAALSDVLDDVDGLVSDDELELEPEAEDDDEPVSVLEDDPDDDPDLEP